VGAAKQDRQVRPSPSGACLEGPAPDLWIAEPLSSFFVHKEAAPIAFRELRVNDQIRIPTVRLFDDTTGEQLGIVPIEKARELAAQRELDLVEVAPQAQPPVCRLMDYGRFKFEALKKEKESRKEHNTINVKEMKLRPKISEHDFQTKFGSVRHFLADGDKVKLTIMFRGREMVHQEYGRKLLDRMAEELKEVAIIERNPLVEGRNMIMIMSPLNKKHAKGDHSNDRRPVQEVEVSVTVPQTEPGAESGSSNDHAEDTNP
jgi:translation initiation factor IF-3